MKPEAWLAEFNDRERMGLANESMALPPEIIYATIVRRAAQATKEAR